jgi:2-polyprenyl-6-methoxyphenol hydroxylase-like FAD-dependent oxidoreductase
MVVSRVLVVGAGVAGLAAARALGLEGVDVHVVDRRSGPPTEGLGVNLPGNAVRALRHLGAADRVLDEGIPVSRREYRAASGRLLFDVDEAAFWASVAPSVCVRRGVLVEALGVGVDVRWGAAVEAVRTDASHVLATVAGAEERYDYVVGADGIHSVVRDSVAPASPRPSAMTGASWRFVTGNPGVDCYTAWTGHGVTLLLIPVAPDEVYGYAASNRGGAAGPEPEWLTSAFDRFPEPVRAVAGRAAADAYHSPVEEIRVEPWHAPRAVLLGDAAHATGPVWAQGAALAMEDALVLARLLGRADDWSDVGPEWERLRRPRVEHVQAATDRMSGLARLPDLVLRFTAPLLGPRGYRHAYEPLRPDPLEEA